MQYLSNSIFLIALAIGVVFFVKNCKKILRNINLGYSTDHSDQKSTRWKNVIRIALGQSKMVVRPVAGLMHIFVYVGFIVINIEVLEIIIDGIFGTHRIFSFMGVFYNILIASFEILAILVLVGVIIFWFRRDRKSVV